MQVLTIDSSGKPLHWATWQEVITLECKGHIAWKTGEQMVKLGGVSRISGERSSALIPTIVGVKNHSRIHRATPALTNRTLFGRDLFLCAYCGKSFPHHKLTREHIVPTSRQGANTWMNCVTACKSCNNRKDDKLLSECGMELLYLPYVPNAAEDLILKNRTILTDQMDFLRGYLPEKSRLLTLQ